MNTTIGLFSMAFIVGLGFTAGALAAGATFCWLKDFFDYLTAPSLPPKENQADEEA